MSKNAHNIMKKLYSIYKVKNKKSLNKNMKI
jgi:hypothetical protein